MFRTFFHGANDYVEMTGEMDRGVLVELGRRRRRRVLIVVSLLMALLVLAPWAASNPTVFGWLSRVAPPVAHFLRPNAGSQVENGIQMEVVEVTRKDDTLLIHLTMEDLEGDRLVELAPEWWEWQQGRSGASGTCVPYYDGQTGLLHLNLSCTPAENRPEFDWDRWVTVNVYDLAARSGTSGTQISVPLILTDCAELKHSTEGAVSRLEEYLTEPVFTLREGRDITCMTVIGDELHVQVRNDRDADLGDYQLFLNGPDGELHQMIHRVDEKDYHCWVFPLRGQDIRDCTLSARMDTTERINGTWTIQVSPATGD